VGYFTVIAQGNCDHVVESDSGFPWNFYRSAEHDLRLDKDTVDAQSPGFVAGNRIRDFVRSPSIRSRGAGVARLVGGIVRNLRLIEISSAAIPIPKYLELLVVLDKQAVHRHIISVHNQSIRAGIAGPAHTFLMVGTPYPSMVDNDVVAIDPQVGLRSAYPAPPTRKNTSCKVIGFCAWRALP